MEGHKQTFHTGYLLGSICARSSRTRPVKDFPKPYAGNGPFLFVCYSHEDANDVKLEIQHLHELGFDVWFDEGIPATSEWNHEIASRINRAEALVFFVTPASVASRHCRDEVNYALRRDTPVLSVHLAPTVLPDGLDLSLGMSQAIKKQDPSSAYRTRLAAALRAVDSSRSAPVEAPESDASTTITLDNDAGPIVATWTDPVELEPVQAVFTSAFVIGRDHNCDIAVRAPMVSRRHVRVAPRGHHWFVEDLSSRNGVLLDERPIATATLGHSSVLRLGPGGPEVKLVKS